MENSLWNHLPLLVRANSKDSVEHILQSLWKTRKTGLHAADRILIRDMLQLQNDSDLDPLLVCLRMLIRRCVKEDISKDEIQNLFPDEVLPELKKLLTLLLQKFQREWREDVLKDQGVIPRLKTMNCDMVNQENEAADSLAVIDLQLQNDARPLPGELEVQFQLQNDARPLPGELEVQYQVGKDSVDNMLKSVSDIRDQLSNVSSFPETGSR